MGNCTTVDNRSLRSCFGSGAVDIDSVIDSAIREKVNLMKIRLDEMKKYYKPELCAIFSNAINDVCKLYMIDVSYILKTSYSGKTNDKAKMLNEARKVYLPLDLAFCFGKIVDYPTLKSLADIDDKMCEIFVQIYVQVLEKGVDYEHIESYQ